MAVIEAVDIGFGASGRNAGMVNPAVWVRPDVVSRTLGPVFGERLLSLLGDSPNRVFALIEEHQIECETRHTGTLHCAVGGRGRAELEHRASQWLKRGVRVDLLDAAETEARVGSSAFVASMLDMRAGTIQPLAYARGLARAAIALNARIFVGQPADCVQRVGSQWRVSTSLGSVTAPWVVVATDAYSVGPCAQIRQEQILLPYFNMATVPLGDTVRRSILPGGHGVWDTKTILSSFRFDREGRLVVGSIGALRGVGRSVHRDWAKRAIRHTFPQIGKVELEAEWYGAIGTTSDSLPRFHKLAPNMISFSGYNGRGIGPGTAFGFVIASYINGTLSEAELPLPQTDPSKPGLRRAREALYEIGSLMAHLAGARAGVAFP